MVKCAVVFPGQGSQYAGMLADYTDHPPVRESVAAVSAAVGVDFAAMIENPDGDNSGLNSTINTQPIMLAMDVGIYEASRAALPPAAVFAGHSLGEYAALVAAGAVPLAIAAKLVRRRAELMQNAVADGGMAAILGLSAETVDTACAAARAAGEQVWAANYNTDNQIVIAGTKESVQHTADTLKTQGAKRCVLLPMSVPSHCPLLAGAAEQFAADLQAVDWQPPTVKILHTTQANTIAETMAKQLTEPIRWTAVLAEFAKIGITTVHESGPGKVLSNLARKTPIPHTPLNNSAAIPTI